MLLISSTAAVFAVQASAVSAAWLLRRKEAALRRQLPFIVSLAVGVLLATALLHLLPEAVATLGNGTRTWALLGGTMLALFSLERIFFAITGNPAEPELEPAHGHEHHHHGGHSTRPMSLVLASMLHSFVDGAAVGVAFLASPRIGWITALAIALHEIPHRMGDFAVLVHLHMPPARALRMAALAGVPSFVGLAAVLYAGTMRTQNIALLLPVSAGSFLYIATANLLPELQEECRWPRVVLQILCLIVGVALVMLAGGVAQS
ncbi:MAG TPA: ZIP family metal transporter [Acidobacteriaceae bacterium]